MFAFFLLIYLSFLSLWFVLLYFVWFSTLRFTVLFLWFCRWSESLSFHSISFLYISYNAFLLLLPNKINHEIEYLCSCVVHSRGGLFSTFSWGHGEIKKLQGFTGLTRNHHLFSRFKFNFNFSDHNNDGYTTIDIDHIRILKGSDVSAWVSSVSVNCSSRLVSTWS